MAQGANFPFVTHVGRLVTGSVSDKQTIDIDGRPIPPDDQSYSMGIAYRKDDPATLKLINDLWQQTAAWYANNPEILTRLGNGLIGTKRVNPQNQRPGLSMKIKDGDEPDSKGQFNENTRGHYVFYFGSNFPPKCCDAQNNDIDPRTVKRGFYVQMAGSAAPNGQPPDRAGIYLNSNIVRLCGYGPEIFSGLTAQQAFGDQPAPMLPPGASATPVAPASGLPGFPGQAPQQPGFPGMPASSPSYPTPTGMPPANPQQPYGYPGGVPGAVPQPTGTAPGFPAATTPAYPTQPAYTPPAPGFAPPAAYPSNPAPGGYPTQVYPQQPAPGMPAGFPGAAPGQAPVQTAAPVPAFVPGAPGAGTMPPSSFPINPATGQPVQPHPAFLGPR